MDKDNNKEQNQKFNKDTKKLSELLKKVVDNEVSLKRIPFYMCLICILLIVLIVKLHSIDKHLETIASDGVIYATFNDTFYEVTTEKEVELEDYVPLLEVLTEEPLYNDEETTSNKTTTTTTTTTKPHINNETTKQNSIDSQSSKETYIININSKKIHYADCSSAIRTKEENKKTVELTDEELQEYLNDGHSFCKTCGGN